MSKDLSSYNVNDFDYSSVWNKSSDKFKGREIEEILCSFSHSCYSHGEFDMSFEQFVSKLRQLLKNFSPNEQKAYTLVLDGKSFLLVYLAQNSVVGLICDNV